MIKIRREVKIGLFAVIALAALYWGINYLKGQDLFRRNNVYYAKYDQINGIQRSSAVKIKGYKVGVVSDIIFNPRKSDKIILELSVNSKFPIPDDSYARIFSDALLGSKSIEIVMGSSNNILSSGDTIMTAYDRDFLEVAGSELEFLKQKITRIVDDVSKTLGVIDTILLDNAGYLNATMKNLNDITGSLSYVLKNEEQTLRDVIANLNEFTGTLKSNSENIDRIVYNVESFTDSLRRVDIASIANNLSSSVEYLNSALCKIDSGEGSLGKLINDDEFYASLLEASGNLTLLIEDIKKNPSRYVSFSIFGGRNR